MSSQWLFICSNPLISVLSLLSLVDAEGCGKEKSLKTVVRSIRR